MRLSFGLLCLLGGIVFGALPYLPPSWLNYIVTERVAVIFAPVACAFLCGVYLACQRKLIAATTILPGIILLVSLYPLIRLGVILLLWKIRGFGP